MAEGSRPPGKAAELLKRAAQDLDEASAAVARRQAAPREAPQQYEDKLRDFMHRARQMTSILELKPLLDRVVQEFVAITGSERGVLLLRDDEGGLEVQSAHNLDSKELEGEEFHRSRVTEEVATSGQSVFVDDMLTRGDYSVRESVIELKLRSLSCVPLVQDGRVLGVCYTDSKHPGKLLADRDRGYLEDFAAQAAVAIINARRLGEVLVDKSRLEAENEDLRRQIERRYRFENILGQSAVMQRLFDMLGKVIATDVNVVLQGETGTGKELIARALQCNGPRRDQAWVSINCGALPETLLESELFGHRRGAFTGAIEDRRGLFEAADGGTLFLDEVGEMPASVQVKLLRVLQEGEFRRVGETGIRKVDVRIIAATNRDLAEEVRSGSFREDLFYRLNVVGIIIPPLRERGNDIVLLAQEFTRRFAEQHSKQVPGLTPDAVRWLLTQPWEGNIRQLENCIERAVTLCENGQPLAADLLPAPLSVAPAVEPGARPRGGTLRQTLEIVERDEVRRALEDSGGQVSEAARHLGVSRQHLHNLIRKHELRPRRRSPKGKDA